MSRFWFSNAMPQEGLEHNLLKGLGGLLGCELEFTTMGVIPFVKEELVVSQNNTLRIGRGMYLGGSWGLVQVIVGNYNYNSSHDAKDDDVKLQGEFSDILDQSNALLREDSKPQITILNVDVDYISASQSNGADSSKACRKLLEIEHLTLQTPQYAMTLVEDLSLVVNKGDHLLIMGPSGSGKTSFLRAIAGLWCSGNGTITFYIKHSKREFHRSTLEEAIDDDELLNENNCKTEKRDREMVDATAGGFGTIFFLPQRPYMVLGTLRQQLLYPTWTEDVSTISESSIGLCPLANMSSETWEPETVEHIFNC
eukprot:Gb_35460 [translate_table: standard]